LIPLRLGKKPHKYKAKPLMVDGIKFASSLEAKYFAELKLCERAGEITDIELQPKFSIDINGIHVCTVIADFRYREKKSGTIHTIDCKGMDMALSKLKRRLVRASFGVDIEIVKRRKR